MYVAKDFKPKLRTTVILSFFLIIMLSMIFYFGIRDKQLLKGNVGYTIGYTTEIFYSYSSGRGVKFYYTVNNRTYHSIATYAYNSQVPGKYLVKFSKYEPDVCEIYQDRPAPFNIVEAPQEGWNYLPW